MKAFLFNLALLAALCIFLYVINPGLMKQVFELYNGLGILGLFILMVLISALPRSPRRR